MIIRFLSCYCSNKILYCFRGYAAGVFCRWFAHSIKRIDCCTV